MVDVYFYEAFQEEADELRSLLPAGITGSHGLYARGDVIDIAGPDGAVIARGLAQYDSGDAERIIGKRSDEVAALLDRPQAGQQIMQERDAAVTEPHVVGEVD